MYPKRFVLNNLTAQNELINVVSSQSSSTSLVREKKQTSSIKILINSYFEIIFCQWLNKTNISWAYPGWTKQINQLTYLWIVYPIHKQLSLKKYNNFWSSTSVPSRFSLQQIILIFKSKVLLAILRILPLTY